MGNHSFFVDLLAIVPYNFYRGVGMKSNGELLKLYVKTKDSSIVGEILENSQDIVTKAVKSALRKHDISEDKYKEYLGCAYIYLSKKIASLERIYDNDSAFYRYIFTTCVNAVDKEISNERYIADNEVSLYSFREDYETLKKEGLVYECEDEMNSDIDLESLKKIIFSKSIGLTGKQIECMIAHYGLEGNDPVAISEIAASRGVTRIEVYHLIGSALIKIRKDIEKKGHKAKISNILESESPKNRR